MIRPDPDRSSLRYPCRQHDFGLLILVHFLFTFRHRVLLRGTPFLDGSTDALVARVWACETRGWSSLSVGMRWDKRWVSLSPPLVLSGFPFR